MVPRSFLSKDTGIPSKPRQIRSSKLSKRARPLVRRLSSQKGPQSAYMFPLRRVPETYLEPWPPSFHAHRRWLLHPWLWQEWVAYVSIYIKIVSIDVFFQLLIQTYMLPNPPNGPCTADLRCQKNHTCCLFLWFPGPGPQLWNTWTLWEMNRALPEACSVPNATVASARTETPKFKYLPAGYYKDP